jgi:SAM-dependent methyltransferase
MPAKSGQDRSNSTAQNISYYNEIAGDYDRILEKDDSNKVVRQKVAGRILAKMKAGRILDFGGGTGQDLEWMARTGFQVVFCEPSPGMRQKAMGYRAENLKNDQVIFLPDSHTDFNTWVIDPPVAEKVDAILANFAVLNNIPNLADLFNSLALVLRPGGYLFALVLDPSDKSRERISYWSALKASLIGSTPSFFTTYRGGRQKVYLHRLNKILKASEKNFTSVTSESFSPTGFMLIEFLRK